MKLTIINKLDQLLQEIKSLDLAEIKGDGIALTETGENVIVNILKAKNFIEQLDTVVKEKLLKLHEDKPLLKGFEGGKVKVGFVSRKTYKITGSPDKEFIQTKVEPNKKAIEVFQDMTGELPIGIESKESQYLTYRKISNDAED